MKSFKEYLREITLQKSTEHRPGIYTGHSHSTRGKKRTMSHEVHAHSEAEAHEIMAGRHRDEHKLMKSDFVHVGHVQYHGAKKTPPPPPPKPPHRDSAEQKWRDEMQKRYDSLEYKGD